MRWGAARWGLTLATLLVAAPASANEGTAGIFVRGDSDATIVVSPRAAVQVDVEENTEVTAAYMADVWTSASIDIRTAATRPVGARAAEDSEYLWITEQRDQLDLSVSHQLGDVSLGGAYYYSGENDYWSHGFTLRATEELFGKSTTLTQSLRFVHDIVGRSGDPNFERPLNTFGARLVWSQILSPDAIVQAVWEGMYRNGFQSSVYRFVGLGGNGMCGIDPETGDLGTASLCVPEAHPSTRIRNAFVLQGRYAFSDDTSAGVGYRFYFDDWGIYSHTAIAQIAWVPAENQTITFRYRFYTQTAAGFYQSRYDPPPGAQIRFVTRDRELSPTFSNRLAFSYQGRTTLTEGVGLKVAFALGGTIFVYPDFVGLDEVYALDGTLSFTLEL
ncbi:MAG: DUF3570 domain-containing protein [Myxococcota bacterium]|nr:DUF3570 domain-containing protein [Myxococcota bacterium]